MFVIRVHRALVTVAGSRGGADSTMRRQETVSAEPSSDLRRLESAWIITAVSAGFLWLMTAGGVLADSLYPPMPDPIVATLAVAAGTATVAAVLLRLSRQGAENLAATTRALGELARGVFLRERVQREILRRILADPERDGVAQTLDRSEYWEVYADVLRDLGGLGLAGDDHSPE